ncbi:MAG: hypothetical protein U0787_13805, partial [Polyangia bacterium]
MDFSMFDDEADDVGQEIEAFCARCKTDTPHTVVSRYDEEIRRVRCNTCDDVHAFRRPRGEDGDEPSEQPSRKKLIKAKPTWEQVINKKKSTPRAWGPDEVFCELDVLTHSVFGVGFVSELIGQNKIEVTFQNDKRILIHNRRLLPLHLVQRQRQEAEARARADGKAKAKEAREAKAAAREAARLAKAHEPELDDLDLPDMLHDDEEIPVVSSPKSGGMGKTTKLSARELAALDDDDDDDSLIGDLDDEGDAPRGRGRKAKGAEPPVGRGRPAASKFADAGDDDDDDADDDFDEDRPSSKSKSSPDGKRRVGRPPGKKNAKADVEEKPAPSSKSSKTAAPKGTDSDDAPKAKKADKSKAEPASGKAAKADKSAGKALAAVAKADSAA